MRDKKKLRLLRAVLLVITIACLLPVGRSCCLSVVHERQQRELKNLKGKTGGGMAPAGNTEGTEGAAKEEADSGGLLVSAELAGLYEDNSDLVGWLAVEGTDIDYPVVQCEDDEFYLSHNFRQENDRYGCLYVKSIADVNTPGTNFIIYGHHMKDGSMFGGLDKYDSESYFRNHRLVSFNTLYEERVYEIMAVFQTWIPEDDKDGGFRYYQFYQADTEKEFRDFYENVMALSIYDTGVTAEFGDTFLTMSTCSSHAENGRFVVVAKRVAK
ncbi:MAG: class B sortase [Lachnospiraceae bacterium]|nr:class B sortase [Lachnospiraceae bacterium]